MKTRLLLLSAALAAVALAPAAQAETGVTVVNPCKSGFGVSAAVADVCADTRATWCTVWIEWNVIPMPDTCLVAPIQPPIASSGPDCMEIYSRNDVGPFSVVQRSSCEYQVYECPYEGAPLSQCRDLLALEQAASASASAPCYYVYTRHDVGAYAVVRRSSCAPPEVYECPYERAPIEQCEPLLRSAAAESASASQPEPMCMYYYHEYELGPVRHVQRDSCHSETYVCDVRVRESLTAEPDPVALATCTVDSLGVLA